jgi:hypothetical protein
MELRMDNIEHTEPNEMDVWEKFRQKYEHQFPTPEKPVARLMSTIGWQFTMILVQSVGAITLASLRTASMFFAAAAGTNPWLKYGEAISAVITVEVGIVVFAAIRAEQENSKHTDEEQKATIIVSLTRLWWGEGLALIISVMAGLGVSFNGFGLKVPLFLWGLSIAIGAGASIIAAVSGDILGAMLARFGNIRDKMARDYTTELHVWRSNLTASWEKSPEREIVRSDTTLLMKQLRAERADGSSVRSVRQRTGVNLVNQPNVSPVAQKIFDYLLANSNGSIPGPKQVEEALGVSRGYASEQIRIWRNAHPEFPVTEMAFNGS